ncbi:prephenate dehydratase [Candidatus Pyrohabitans sp.]
MTRLEQMRKEIDEIDAKLLELLRRRIRIAEQVGRYKLARGMRIEDPEREKQVISRALAKAEGLSEEFVREIFERIILESKRAQRQGKIAILGPRGTFSEEAALKFMSSPHLVLAREIEEIFDLVERGEVEFGVLPVENSLEGSVTLAMELLVKREARVYAEIILDINHNLLALPGVKLAEIRRVISHPQALAQCKGFISSLGVATANYPSTADAAREIKEKQLRDVAAIAPLAAAKLYGLAVLKEKIQDMNHNQTRFFILAKRDHAPTGRDKTSIVLSLKDKPGALYEVLEAFAKAKINLTKIESRPSRRALGDYIFFIDFEGHRTEDRIKAVLEEIERRASFMKILGSYPAG